MTSSKHTRRALLASILSMLLCAAMLVGSTFAWFTDSVTSGKNKIVAGSLDVELEYATEFDADGNPTAWEAVTENTKLFSDVEADGATENLWEPGHTEAVYLRVRNAGTLALKYRFAVNVFGNEEGTMAEQEYTNVNGGKFKLSSYLVFQQKDGAAEAKSREELWIADAAEEKTAMGRTDGLGLPESVLLAEESKEITLSVYMPTSVGNEANQLTSARDTEGSPTIYLGLDLFATQTPYENDGFDNQYDANAWVTGQNVQAAIDAGGPVILAQSFEVSFTDSSVGSKRGQPFSLRADSVVDLNRNTVSIKSQSGYNGLYFSGDDVEGATATICNGTITIDYTPGTSWGAVGAEKTTLVLENMTITAQNYDGTTARGYAVDAEGAKGTKIILRSCTINGNVMVGSGAELEAYDTTINGTLNVMTNGKAVLENSSYTGKAGSGSVLEQ